MTLFLTSILTFIGSLFFTSPPEHEIISNKIVAETSKKITNTYNLSLMGTGGSMMKDVKMLSISFGTKECLDIQQGRKIIHECTKQLINDVNSNEEIRPYLHNFPFDSKNIKIRIFCFNKEGNDQKPPYLAYVSILYGNISYEIYKDKKYHTILSETYAEAEKILQNQKSK